MNIARRLAALMIRHTLRVMPESRTEWAQGMAREIHHIDNDREALSWAVGCVSAAYGARLRAQAELARGVRLLLAAWCVAGPLLFFYRTALFSMCPFYTANPECQAMLNPVPFALHGIANTLYLVTAIYLVRNRMAFRPYITGFLFILASETYIELLPNQSAIFFTLRTAYEFYTSDLGSFRPPGGYPVAIIMTTLVVPLMMGLAIWLMDRYRDTPEAAPAKD
jgi:hypothetical protein